MAELIEGIRTMRWHADWPDTLGWIERRAAQELMDGRIELHDAKAIRRACDEAAARLRTEG